MTRLTSSFTCQLISVIITTLVILHSFTPGSKPTFSTNFSHPWFLRSGEVRESLGVLRSRGKRRGLVKAREFYNSCQEKEYYSVKRLHFSVKIWHLRCHILRLKCTKFNFSWGSTPDPAGGAYSAAPGQCNKLLLQTYTPTIVLLVLHIKKSIIINRSLSVTLLFL